MRITLSLALALSTVLVDGSSFSEADETKGVSQLDLAAQRYKLFMEEEVPKCFAKASNAMESNPNDKCEIVGTTVILESGKEFKVQSSDVVIAKTRRDIASFCNKRSMYAYLSQLEGILATELVVASGIPDHCLDRVAIYERLGVSASLSSEFAADALELIGRLHQAGFAHTALRRGVFGLDLKGELQLGQLFSIAPLFRQSGEIVPNAGTWMKGDLVTLLEELLTEHLGDTQVHESLLQAARKSAPENGNYFNFDYWVEVLRQLAAGNVDFEYTKAPRGHLAVADASMVNLFNELNENCLTQLPGPLIECLSQDGCICPPVNPFVVADIGEVRIRNPKLPEGDFHGEYGMVFRTTGESSVLMKVFTRFDEPSVLCSEKSMLSALNGFGGFVPRHFEILEGVHEACKVKAFVMERVGSEEVDIRDSLWHTEKASFYRIYARGLELLENLHDAGFIHGDLHIDNIKVDNEEGIEASLKFIDFGRARPYVNATGHHLLDVEASRRVDMEKFASEIYEAGGRMPEFSQEFLDEMASLGREERPNYRKWIDLFRSMIPAV